MKKYIILIIIILIELFAIKIPNYVELNDLAIIEEIAIEHKSNNYTIILKEIIPIKADQGINYEYKYYEESASTIKKAYQKLTSRTKKKLYLHQAKSLITNIKFSKPIKKTLNIKPKNIIHTNNVQSKIKDK